MYYLNREEIYGRESDQHSEPKGASLTTAVYFNSNFTHNKVTKKSVSEIIFLPGKTLYLHD